MNSRKHRWLTAFLILTLAAILVACSQPGNAERTPNIPATVAAAVDEALPAPAPTPDIPATVAVAVQEALPTPQPTPDIPATVAVAVQEALPTPQPTPDIPATVAVAMREVLPSPQPTPDIPATVAAVVAIMEQEPTATPQPRKQADSSGMLQYSQPPEMQLDSGAEYSATIVTNLGDIAVLLYASEAPITVNNFLFLAGQGFYDGTVFHRVIPNFMIQGGDPAGTGTGGPGYKFQDELSPSLNYDNPGVLAMANAGPDTNGSQFFITVAPTPHLQGFHTVFGKVIEGQDVVDAIATVSTDRTDRPLEDVVIETIEFKETSGG